MTRPAIAAYLGPVEAALKTAEKKHPSTSLRKGTRWLLSLISNSVGVAVGHKMKTRDVLQGVSVEPDVLDVTVSFGRHPDASSRGCPRCPSFGAMQNVHCPR